MNTRIAILNGKLELPEQIIELVGSEYRHKMNAMFQALWTNYKNNKGSISATYWADRFNNNVVFNKYLRLLSKAGWITTLVEPKRNWAEVHFNETKLAKWVTTSDVMSMRQYDKFNKYKLTTESTETPSLTRINGKTKSTGLVRNGQAKQSSAMFKYDTIKLYQYKEEIILNVTKSVRKLELEYGIFKDDVDYKAVATAIVEHHLYSPEVEFCLGGHVSDSRGRAISSALSKVFNPIGFKDARALLVVEPRSLGEDGYTQVYLAIAELLGIKCDTIEEKVTAGYEAYGTEQYLDLDLDTEEGRKDLHENIWLERIYENLQEYHGTNWTVPIEVDATASILQVEGVLLNHKPYMEATNIIGDTLDDVWTVDGIPRAMYKAVATPSLYGSSATPQELWTANKMKFTAEQATAMNRDISNGMLSVSDKFKEFIISNVKPKAEMTVKVWGEEFTVECNKKRNVGDYTKKYDVYDSKTNTVKSIYHTHTHKEVDLKQFTRYFVTLLVHNIDSQIADTVANELDWCIPIYDAFIVHPADAVQVKEVYTAQLNQLHKDRSTVLSEYFASIGIDSKSAVAWKHVTDSVEPLEGELQAQHTALK